MTLSVKARDQDIIYKLKKKFIQLITSFKNNVFVTTDIAPSRFGKNAQFCLIIGQQYSTI